MEKEEKQEVTPADSEMKDDSKLEDIQQSDQQNEQINEENKEAQKLINKETLQIPETTESPIQNEEAEEETIVTTKPNKRKISDKPEDLPSEQSSEKRQKTSEETEAITKSQEVAPPTAPTPVASEPIAKPEPRKPKVHTIWIVKEEVEEQPKETEPTPIETKVPEVNDEVIK